MMHFALSCVHEITQFETFYEDFTDLFILGIPRFTWRGQEGAY